MCSFEGYVHVPAICATVFRRRECPMGQEAFLQLPLFLAVLLRFYLGFLTAIDVHCT